MGCDGGTIPKRNELVKTKKKPEKKDKDAELASKWRYCAIKQELLQTPIVGCGLGRLYSKESVLRALLDRSLMPSNASHIKSLKDVKNLKMTENPNYKSRAGTHSDSLSTQAAPFICPIVSLEMNGNYRFMFLWSCGCVFSERAFKEVSNRTKNCPQCQAVYTEDDVVILNPSAEEYETLKSRYEKRHISNKKVKTASNNSSEKTKIAKKESDDKEMPNDRSNKRKNCSELVDSEYRKIMKYSNIQNNPNFSATFKSIFKEA